MAWRSDRELVEAASGGDESAWEELVDRHSGMIYANARVLGAEPALADDIVQVTWGKLLGRLDALAQPDKVSGWLAIVARNATRSALRRASRRDVAIEDVFGSPDSDSGPERAVERADEMRRLRAAWRLLGDHCQTVLAMRFVDSLSYNDMAEALSVPLGTVSKRRRDCLSQLKRLFGNQR